MDCIKEERGVRLMLANRRVPRTLAGRARNRRWMHRNASPIKDNCPDRERRVLSDGTWRRRADGRPGGVETTTRTS
eukprot:9147993-Heterocapsa_arctica.AAC.1